MNGVCVDPVPALKQTCPRCHAAITPMPIIYSSPRADVFAAADAGHVTGGRVIEAESPESVCPRCDALLPWVDPFRAGVNPGCREP